LDNIFSPLYLLTGLSKAIPNYTCKNESKSVAVLTGTMWATNSQTGILLQLYKFPQVRWGRVGWGMMASLMAFSGA
jgi:hypothetical protein